MNAKAGQGEALARLMLTIAEGLRSTPGCELYVINREPENPDIVWVNELWTSREAVDASLAQLRSEEGQARMAEVFSLLDGSPERVDVEPLGGVGFAAHGGTP
jgi:quinol monooxygenase YgiN